MIKVVSALFIVLVLILGWSLGMGIEIAVNDPGDLGVGSVKPMNFHDPGDLGIG